MVDWFKEVTSGAPAPGPDTAPPTPPAETDKKIDWFAQVTGKGDGSELRQQPRGTRMPGSGASNIINDPAQAASGLTSARASLAPDVGDQIKRYATARGIDPARYGVVNGNIVFDDGKGNLVREVPSVEGGNGVGDTIDRTGKYLSSQIGPAIPTAAGITAGVLAGPTATSIPAAGGAAAAADVGRQVLDRMLAGEDPTNIDFLNAAGHGAMNALPQAGAVGITKALSRNPLGVAAADRLAALDPARLAAAQAVVDAGKARGIPVFIDEATGLPSLRQQARQLRRYPDTADEYGAVMERRNTDAIPTGARQEFDKLGRLKTAEEAVGGARDAAQAVLDTANEARSAAASPHYNRAFDSGVSPDINSTLGIIQDHAKGVATGSQSAKSLRRVEGMLTKTEDVVDPATGQAVQRTVPETDYRKLHSAKLNIDKMLEDISDKTLSVDKETKRALTIAKQDLTTQLRAAHEGYETGYQTFMAMSPAIKELERGGVGILAKKTGVERAQLLDDVFSSSRTTPEAVTKTRQAFRLAGKGAEFDDAMRFWLEDNLGAAQKTANTANQLGKRLWDDPRQRAVLEAAIGDTGKFKSMTEFMDVINAVRKALPEGSPTAGDAVGMDALKNAAGTGLKLVGKGFSPITYANIGNELVEGVSALRAPAARRALADAMMDPDALKTLGKLRMLPPGGEKAMTLVTEFLTNALAAGTGVRQPGDRRVGTGQ